MGDHPPRLAQRGVDLVVERARLDPHLAGGSVVVDAVHRREVDHQAAAGGIAAIGMPAAAQGEGHVVVAAPAQHVRHHLRRGAGRDALRADMAVAQIVGQRLIGEAGVGRPQQRAIGEAVQAVPAVRRRRQRSGGRRLLGKAWADQRRTGARRAADQQCATAERPRTMHPSPQCEPAGTGLPHLPASSVPGQWGIRTSAPPRPTAGRPWR